MNYDIIATLGPASDDPSMWRRMADAGVTGFRLNTSHLDRVSLGRWLEALNSIPEVPITLDLQGGKWRLGTLPETRLREDEVVELVYGESMTRPGSLPVPHPDFFQAAPDSGGEIVLNDAKVRLKIESIADQRIEARVTLGGPISPAKGITLADSTFRKEGLGEKDRQIVAETRSMERVRYAVSYVKDAEEMRRFREGLGDDRYAVAKLERPGSLQDADGIVEAADELWLCRGDLGAEMGLRGMAEAAGEWAGRLASLTKPTLLAGQVLEHMTRNPTPTRAEVCALHDALEAGYTGVVLSDETAIGAFPVEACAAAALFR